MSVLEFAAVSKQYGALRPLRIEQLTVSEGEQVVLVGLDQPAAEVFISLATGAGLPDSGTIRAFNRLTAEITDSQEWLASLDRLGIVTDRAALLGALSVVQNLSMPFTLDIEPPPPDVREKAEALAGEVAIERRAWDAHAAELRASDRMRLHLARALALDPALVIIEHPSASLDAGDVGALAADVRRIIAARGIAAVTLTMDRTYASASGGRVLTLNPANGRLTDASSGRFKFWSR